MRRKYSVGILDPISALNKEIQPYRNFLKGKVLNAGAGSRKIPLGEECINLDIIATNKPDIVADLNQILPLDDFKFDAVFSNACLEHVPRPWFTIKELFRVTKPGGYIVLCIPFIQPFHAWPHDYTRFTWAGMESLLKEGGYEIIKIEANKEISFGYTLSWLLTEYYSANPKKWRYMKFFWKPIFYLLKRGYLLGAKSPNTESAYFAIGKKPL